MTETGYRQAVCCSAPGKVLLAGGYLVLDPAYSGLVIGLSSRIYAVVQSADGDSNARPGHVVVKSPQFEEAQWEYEVNGTDVKSVK